MHEDAVFEVVWRRLLTFEIVLNDSHCLIKDDTISLDHYRILTTLLKVGLKHTV